jgi:hypothetical protein
LISNKNKTKTKWYCIHFFFKDTDGHEEYYANYSELRQHFLRSHFLCEIDGCSKNGAETHEYVVFRTELDFQAHKKQKHAKNKGESKSFGKLNIEFNVRESDNMQRFRRRNEAGGNDPGPSTSSNSNRGNQSEASGRGGHSQKKKESDEEVMRLSREQFQRDEDERKRKKLAEEEEKKREREEQERKASVLTSIDESALQSVIDYFILHV